MESFTDGSWLHSVGLGQYQARQEVLLRVIQENKINLLMLVVFLALAYRQFASQRAEAKKVNAEAKFLEAPGFPDIQSLVDFKWQDQEPLKLRFFKKKYFLTMAIENLNPSELLLMDNTYQDRIRYRKKIMQQSPEMVIGVNDDKRVGPAVRELYTYLIGTYLPKRYPNMFKLHLATFESGRQFMLENLVTKAVYPTVTSERSDTKILLQTLGATIDEDFLFLLPENGEDASDPKYKLEAYICICPSGWSPPAKLGKRLAEIHGPVPSYKDKLEASMDRYFKGLEVGKYVRRSNWAIVQSDEMFSPNPGSNHGKEGETIKELVTIDPEKTYLRCERQTLHRLPKSHAIVFAFKTYIDSLKVVKEEGLGEDLADAIDGLKTGNAPGMQTYKRAAAWGTAAKKYLRS